MDGLMEVIPTLLGGAILIGATALVLDKTLDRSASDEIKDGIGSIEKPKAKSILEEAGI